LETCCCLAKAQKAASDESRKRSPRLTQLHVRVILWDFQWATEEVLAALKVDKAAAHVADGVAIVKAATAGEEPVGAQRALVEADVQRLLYWGGVVVMMTEG
jgi:hypothetical protein